MAPTISNFNALQIEIIEQSGVALPVGQLGDGIIINRSGEPTALSQLSPVGTLVLQVDIPNDASAGVNRTDPKKPVKLEVVTYDSPPINTNPNVLALETLRRNVHISKEILGPITGSNSEENAASKTFVLRRLSNGGLSLRSEDEQ